jgi:hypothetical protein
MSVGFIYSSARTLAARPSRTMREQASAGLPSAVRLMVCRIRRGY